MTILIKWGIDFKRHYHIRNLLAKEIKLLLECNQLGSYFYRSYYNTLSMIYLKFHQFNFTLLNSKNIASAQKPKTKIIKNKIKTVGPQNQHIEVLCWSRFVPLSVRGSLVVDLICFFLRWRGVRQGGGSLKRGTYSSRMWNRGTE